MAITPQAIKDQEFQSRFRGFDTIEVKAYLELIAEEFFELLEKVRQQEEAIGDLERQRELAEEVNKRLEGDCEAAQRTIEELRLSLTEKDSRQAELQKEFEELQTALDDFEQERKEFEEELSEAEARVSERDELLRASRLEMDSLRNKISFLEEQHKELKQGEIDFKRTIGAAQRFADDLMDKTRRETEELLRQSEERAQEMLRASEEKSNQALQATRDEIERLRQAAYAELSRLPEEIERLSRQRKQARDELQAILTRHLEELESFSAVEEQVVRYDYEELFQKIEFPEDDDGSLDGLDAIAMDLTLTEEISETEDEDLRRKLEEGGVAYLSDEA